jgi:nucleotide-binding universal stress UspA family protein
MTSTVLVPLDGSDKDARALPVAAAIAELADASVRVVRVFDTPIESLSAKAGPLGVLRAARDNRDGVVSAVRAAADHVGQLVRSPTTWEVIDESDVAAALLRDIEVHAVTAVVMATRAAGTVGRAIQGSVADRLVRESPRPVVVVPPHARHLGDKRLRLRRVLVPLDGSEASLGAVTALLTWPHAGKLECILIRVAPTSRHATPSAEVASPAHDGIHETAKLAEEDLNHVAERLRGMGATVEVRVVEARDAGAAILDAVRSELVEMIAMSTHGNSGFSRVVLGSVADVVVRGSEIPVMLVTR